MSQKWYNKTTVQAATVSGIFLVTSAIITELFSLKNKSPEVEHKVPQVVLSVPKKEKDTTIDSPKYSSNIKVEKKLTQAIKYLHVKEASKAKNIGSVINKKIEKAEKLSSEELYNEGNKYLIKGDHSKAKICYELSKGQDETLLKTHYAIIHVLELEENWEKSEKMYNSTISCFKQSERYNYLFFEDIATLYREGNNFQMAIKYYSECCKKDATKSFIYYNMAYCFGKLGDSNSQIQALEKCIETSLLYKSTENSDAHTYAQQDLERIKSNNK